MAADAYADPLADHECHSNRHGLTLALRSAYGTMQISLLRHENAVMGVTAFFIDTGHYDDLDLARPISL